MSRIEDRFTELRKARRTGLVTYVTAGDPDLQRSAEIIKRLDTAGADVLEIGVPFSDPLADGPVIQRATERALAAGVTLPQVLGMLKTLRPAISAPIVIFSYANPILRMGLDTFVTQATAAGVDGVLTLDMPPEEGEMFRAAFGTAGIDTIFLLSPTTTGRAHSTRGVAWQRVSVWHLAARRHRRARQRRRLGARAGHAGEAGNGDAAGARLRDFAARARAVDRRVRRCRGGGQRPGQRDRGARADSRA